MKNKIYVYGGRDSFLKLTNKIERYNLENN